ncbi:hypothetical protein CLNEO_01410 [Anaerotignum neopropionicum]|uniref:Uncharacterized protein n=1 Tax=Anaerotignum neopropionicum TaxID=36847 RepID=A0A136WHN4_9FIRM|nr:hypothetical protein [Anaerotignum neopropionicum]KXL54045.1 hypothetical protein CLNEO_01410 [Anaerotignum neopropionicum]
MKRFFSIILSGIFVLSTVAPTFASEPTNNINMVENMINCGASRLINESTEKSGVENYTIETAGVLANIKKEPVSNGDLYTVHEGELTNEILITPIGEIYLDGNLVTFSTTSQATATSDITTRSYYESWDYNDRAFAPGPYTSNEITKKTTVRLEQKISQLSLSVIAGIVAAGLFKDMSVGVAAGLLSYKGLAEYYDWLNAFDPEASCLYIKKTTWTNGNPDLGSSTLKYYFKITTEYYKDSKYKDYHSGGTIYALQSINNH